MGHLWRVVSRMEVAFYSSPPPPQKKEKKRKEKEKTSSMKQAELGDMVKKVFKSVCISTVVLSSDFLSHTPSASSTIKTPENTK